MYELGADGRTAAAAHLRGLALGGPRAIRFTILLPLPICLLPGLLSISDILLIVMFIYSTAGKETQCGMTCSQSVFTFSVTGIGGRNMVLLQWAERCVQD